MPEIPIYDGGRTYYEIGTIIKSGEASYYIVVDQREPRAIKCTTNDGRYNWFKPIPKPEKTNRGNQMIELMGGL